MNSSHNPNRVSLVSIAILLLAASPLVFAGAGETPGAKTNGGAQNTGTLQLTVVDAASGRPVPALVEVLDSKGRAYVAEDALPTGSCYRGRDKTWQGTFEQALAALDKSFENPYLRRVQFYTTGTCKLILPVGDYTVRVFRGPEYTVQTRPLKIAAGQSSQEKIELTRWGNMAGKGWYSADCHLHIARPFKELNPYISKWMQGEDLHVANLHQFGNWGNQPTLCAAPQYAHGEAGVYREGDYLLVSGQEDPRTTYLGHVEFVGLQSLIYHGAPDQWYKNLTYVNCWKEARRQGALNGISHWAANEGASAAIALALGNGGLLDYIQVLEALDANYQPWYDTLNSGFRVVPLAGVDYISMPCIPGRERFYTRVEGPLSYASWVEGIRRGRTFVSNGPVLEFRVQGKNIGDELLLSQPGKVRVEARVRFDPSRDNVLRLQVIQNGAVVKSVYRKGPSAFRGGIKDRGADWMVRNYDATGCPDEITCDFELQMDETSWLAVRASGDKLGEAMTTTKGITQPRSNRSQVARASKSHSAPIYVTIQGAPGLAEHARAKALARVWIAHLEELEARLSDDQISHLAADCGWSVPVAEMRKTRTDLLEAIENAKRYFAGRAR